MNMRGGGGRLSLLTLARRGSQRLGFAESPSQRDGPQRMEELLVNLAPRGRGNDAGSRIDILAVLGPAGRHRFHLSRVRATQGRKGMPMFLVAFSARIPGPPRPQIRNKVAILWPGAAQHYTCKIELLSPKHVEPLQPRKVTSHFTNDPSPILWRSPVSNVLPARFAVTLVDKCSELPSRNKSGSLLLAHVS